MSRSHRIAVLGAGPVGIEAALLALQHGFDVRVYERDSVGGNVLRWGHVRLFSAWALNTSERGRSVLSAAGVSLPEPERYPTGEELVERYLEPLARSAALSGRIHERTRVVGIARDGIGKGLLPAARRAEHPFRLLLDRSGEERIEEADVVLDCTGTYGNHTWMGNGNLPALGERGAESRIDYELRDVAGGEREAFENHRVLVVGCGHSAATALDALRSLESVRVDWVFRRPAHRPLHVIPDDPLPKRKRLSELANELASGHDGRFRLHPESHVEAVRPRPNDLEVDVRTREETTTLVVDRILAHVGYSPDNSIYRELQVHECYASMGPMKLAAALLGEASADCLAQTSKGVETLSNPEPSFFILGAKSYGRGSNFLIRLGLQQVEEVLGQLARNEKARKEEAS